MRFHRVRCSAQAHRGAPHRMVEQGWPHEFGQWNSGLLPTSSRHSSRQLGHSSNRQHAVVRATKQHRRHPDAAPGRETARSRAAESRTGAREFPAELSRHAGQARRRLRRATARARARTTPRPHYSLASRARAKQYSPYAITPMPTATRITPPNGNPSMARKAPSSPVA